jgi:hypothetical protein
MTNSSSAGAGARQVRRAILVILVVAGAGLVGTMVDRSLAAPAPTSTSTTDTFGSAPGGGPPNADPSSTSTAAPPIGAAPPPVDPGRGERRGAVGEADGAVPDGVTVFDDQYPAISRLDPALFEALRQAASDAADAGVHVIVNSGWRSPEYQNQLLREAAATYGSEEEAARWVATADTSTHVSGDAVDLGPSAATVWLSEHGADYGLCQIYSNEPWHFELHPDAIDHACPSMYTDPTHDPRMQQ